MDVDPALIDAALRPDERAALAVLAERLWETREALAREWSRRLLALTPDEFPPWLTLDRLTEVNAAFLSAVLEPLRAGDLVALSRAFYRMNRQLIEFALRAAPTSRLSLTSLYTSARISLQVLSERLGREDDRLLAAYSKLAAHLMMLVGLAYSDCREEALQRSRDELEATVHERTAALRNTNAALEAEIAERGRAEANLRREKALAETIIDTLPGIFYLFDQQARFLRWNVNFERVSQYSTAEVAAMSPLEFFEGAGREHVAERIAQVFRDGQATAQADFIAKDGTRAPYFFTGQRVVVDERVCCIGMGIDITERKLAEDALQRRTQELARSNADLEQFAYVASHDLQEPLRAVASFTQLLARRNQDRLDGDARRYIERTLAAVGRMQALIRDLLAYSRVGTRGEAFDPTPCETVLRDALDNLQAAIAETDAEVTHDPLPVIAADAPQLRQLFQNLIGNAIKFRGACPPRVHVSATRHDGMWRFAVRDNGIGIEREYAERVFVIFQRLHSRRTYPGTGVGLAICKKIVERHGGRIWIEAAGGTGTTVYFELPMRPLAADRPLAAVSS
jgi:PAS domain S-box-containing protein